MRLHRLEVTAFGPFAGTVEVDLDTLSEAGLFLLTGATGAGKTSVLDAVCFALYGDVPGDRGAAKRLRSDQAAEGARPRVELELTVSGRRLRLVRSPAWERAKKRGTGTTTEQASVVVSERVGAPPDAQWRTLSTRLDETGQLVGDLLGMTLTQFTQVAMLPQGRFQAFLRARSEDRHRLLQQLFRTGRFEDVEGWLRERRRTLRTESDRVQEVVADLASRVSEIAVVDPPAPDAWEEDLLGWATGARSGLGRQLTAATEVLADAAEREERARRQHQETAELLERQRRWDEARREQAALEERRAEHEREVEALDAARRAVPVVVAERRYAGCLDELVRLDRRLARARSAPALAGEPLGDVPGEGLPGSDLLDPLADRADLLTLATAGVREALPRAEQLLRAEAALPALSAAVRRAREALDVLLADQRELPERARVARERLASLTASAAALPSQREALESLLVRRRAAQEAAVVATSLAVARSEHLEARERAASSHEALLSVREARIASMASELAGALAVGACCPVCGSAEHPAKARPAPGAADAAAERTAQRRLDDDKAAEHARAEHVRDLELQHARLLERADGIDLSSGPAGGSDARHDPGLEEADALLDALRARCEESAAAEAAVPAAEAELGRIDQARADLEAALSTARDDLARAREERTHALREVERLDADVLLAAARARRALDGSTGARTGTGTGTGTGAGALDTDPALLELPLDGRPDLAALHATLSARTSAVRDLLALLRERAAAEAALSAAAVERDDAAGGAGFPDVDSALAAALDDRDQAALADGVQQHRACLAAVAAVLADAPRDHEADDRSGTPTPTEDDLAAAAQQHREALSALGDARSRAATLGDRCGRLTALVAELEAAMAQWTPLRRELDLTTQVSALVDGRSSDNILQMRLSAYILAWRLSQVVDAANERLARMSDQRYSLEHTGRRGAGETRGGLSLLVRDDWSGESRDPVTLSGGETFVVSLALALGLADVISQEAGGTELDTLFVDEGFGSLDADTLEDVMDTLDSLREGGRVVGVVSHVAEMRDRIPVQLHVTKGRSGSTLALHRGV